MTTSWEGWEEEDEWHPGSPALRSAATHGSDDWDKDDVRSRPTNHASMPSMRELVHMEEIGRAHV